MRPLTFTPISIGHKYGLVYAGVGWVLWRDRKYVPKDMIFKVRLTVSDSPMTQPVASGVQISYLGGSLENISLNFSRQALRYFGRLKAEACADAEMLLQCWVNTITFCGLAVK
jgi:hypothetical protein